MPDMESIPPWEIDEDAIKRRASGEEFAPMGQAKRDVDELLRLLAWREHQIDILDDVAMARKKKIAEKATRLDEAERERDRLLATVRRLMINWPGDPMSDQPHVPQHACGYFIGKASCEFHEWWADAAVACGLMDEWAEEDAGG